MIIHIQSPDFKGLDNILGACNPPSDEKPIQMTTEELVGTFTFLIVSGNEITANVLTGISATTPECSSC
jgi:cytochrome P450